MSGSDEDDVRLGDSEEKPEEDYSEETASKQKVRTKLFDMKKALMFIIKINRALKTIKTIYF